MSLAVRHNARLGWYGYLASPWWVVTFHGLRVRFYRHGSVVG